MKTLLLAAGCFTASITMISATETRFASGPEQTALIELYTSEGCSSCPPAEAWMSRLKNDPGLWKQFVPVAFHVDYWNNLGWRDRFSSSRWTERQRRYGTLWQSESVYTPAVVRNGNEERNWAGSNLSRPNEEKAGLLTARTVDGRTFAVDYELQDGNAGAWEAHVAFLRSGISSKIGAGENSGRDLLHDFIVRELRDAEMKSAGGTLHSEFTFDLSNQEGGRKAVAIWVSRRGQLTPVQATGGWLPLP
jgi:hypothetical protein